ncbi:MAG TPA: hypothetical protein VJ570_00615 [Holophagaceae bacterium]|nr:hypothetical protein [Holophagaceae bacterium]
MKRTISHVGTILVICLAAGSPALAQEVGFGSAFKVRAGVGLGTAKDGLNRRTLGLGFEVSYGLPVGRMGLELGYQYKPGTQYLTDLSTMPVAPGMTVDATQSVDSRKNQLDGVMARLGFERRLGEGPFSLRLGAQVGGTKFRQEYIGDVTNGTTYEDTYNGIVSHNKLAVSPFVGVAYELDKEQTLEVNVVGLNYTAAHYVHVAGTVPGGNGGNTAWDYVRTEKRTQPHIEFCYVLRF